LPDALALLFASLSFFAVGFVLAGLFSTVRTAQLVGQLLYFPMLFLSGAVFPRAVLPEAVQWISGLLPLTYVVDLVQGLWLRGQWDYTALIILGALLGVCLVVSGKTFRWK
jgi:ABC-2 type transport system permease protein